jgi:hypothetical protein
MERVDRAGRDEAMAQARSRLEAGVFRAAWEAGQGLHHKEAVSFALD